MSPQSSFTDPVLRGGPGAPPPGQAAQRSAQPTSRIWLWAPVAFALQIAAWTAWFVIASHHHVAEVPLAR